MKITWREIALRAGLILLLAGLISIVMNLLNAWHPVMGLGDVLYFVVAGGVAIVWLWKPEEKK